MLRTVNITFEAAEFALLQEARAKAPWHKWLLMMAKLALAEDEKKKAEAPGGAPAVVAQPSPGNTRQESDLAR